MASQTDENRNSLNGANADELPKSQNAPAANDAVGASASGETGDGANKDEESVECPICFEVLEKSEVAMKCTGAGGVAHAFHKECLQQWMNSRIAERAEPTCPICRGPVAINIRRMRRRRGGRRRRHRGPEFPDVIGVDADGPDVDDNFDATVQQFLETIAQQNGRRSSPRR